jgi:hypothetical protein
MLSQEILNICRTICQQNYFSHNDTPYIQNDGLVMGASTTLPPPEIYLQYLGNTKIFNILLKH